MSVFPMKKLFTKTQTPEELRTPFKYESLEGTEIRLLRLHPSSDHGFAKLLSGSLKTIRLQDDNIFVSTQFEALPTSGVPKQPIAHCHLTILLSQSNQT